jgi:F-type H+-transporting ATPase subunit delta
MSAHSLATRYAKSLIQLSGEKGQLDQVFSDIKDIDRAFEGSRDLKLMFKSPLITSDKKLNVVKQLFEGKVNEILYRFLILMINKGREKYFHEMVQSFIIQYNEIKNITPVTLTSAVKLDPAFVQKMIASLKAKENLGEVQLHEVIDESLIGGFILQYADKMLNSSVSKNLHALRNIIEDDSYVKKYS